MMQATVNMNRFLLSLYIICLVHTEVLQNCVNSMVVNDIESGGSYLAKVSDHNENHQPEQQQPHHNIRHSHNQPNHPHHHHHHSTHGHRNLHHHQADAHHHVDAGNHNDVEIGHTQPNMWQILGQTVKSVDEKPDKHFDEQQMLGKMNNLNQKVNCPKCQNRPELRMTEEELTKLRIEYVKNQILKKLRLTERPNVSATNLPRPIAEGSMIYPEDEEVQQHHVFEQFYGKTTQKIIFLELDDEKCKGVENFGSYMCFTFEIPADINFNDVDAAELWVYRQPDPHGNEAQSFLVSEIESWDSKKINKPFAIHYANSSEGWGKIDFTWSIRNWMEYRNLYHVIDISCNTCEKHPTVDLFSLDYGYRPFIVVNTTSSPTLKRQRRSINCSPGISECCRDKLYISFKEIGWNWILYPEGYDAYFCRGSCGSAATIRSKASQYHLFARSMLQNQSSQNKEKSFELVPCCTATQFSSLDILFLETNSTATRMTLPNMVVEACGCM